VKTTKASEGPRSSGAPAAGAGPDQIIAAKAKATLKGAVKGSGKIQWVVLAGPGTVKFGSPARPTTTATFSAPGHYVLALSVNNNVHAVAYDAVTVDVLQ
jgi:uncharacterized protein